MLYWIEISPYSPSDGEWMEVIMREIGQEWPAILYSVPRGATWEEIKESGWNKLPDPADCEDIRPGVKLHRLCKGKENAVKTDTDDFDLWKYGAFLFVYDAEERKTLTDAEADRLREAYNLPDWAIPEPPSGRVALNRAVERANRKIVGDIRRVKSGRKEVPHTIVRDKEIVAKFTWIADTEHIRVEVGSDDTDMTTFMKVYEAVHTTVEPSDWTPCLRGVLSSIGAILVRSDGRVYWGPPKRVVAQGPYDDMLREVGITIVRCPVSPDYRSIAWDVAREHLESSASTLSAEVEEMDGEGEYRKKYRTRMEAAKALMDLAAEVEEIFAPDSHSVCTRVRSDLERLVERLQDLIDNWKSKATAPAARRSTPTSLEPPPDLVVEPASPEPSPWPVLTFGGGRFTSQDGRTWTSTDAGAIALAGQYRLYGLLGDIEDCGALRYSPGDGMVEISLKNDLQNPATVSALQTRGIRIEIEEDSNDSK